MRVMSKKPAKVPAAKLPDALRFIPHPQWDPIGPIDLGAAVNRELATIRLQHQQEVTALQSKALEKALAAVKDALS